MAAVKRTLSFFGDGNVDRSENPHEHQAPEKGEQSRQRMDVTTNSVSSNLADTMGVSVVGHQYGEAWMSRRGAPW